MMIDSIAEARDAVAGGYSLPAGWYSDPAVYRLERERIFHLVCDSLTGGDVR